MNLQEYKRFDEMFREKFSTVYNALNDLDEQALRTAATLLQLELNATKKELELETHNRILYEKALGFALDEVESRGGINEPEEGFYFVWVNKAEEDIENESKK